MENLGINQIELGRIYNGEITQGMVIKVEFKKKFNVRPTVMVSTFYPYSKNFYVNLNILNVTSNGFEIYITYASTNFSPSFNWIAIS